MKHDIPPPYGPVAFRDRSTGRVLPSRSTLPGRRREQSVESEGRVERFQRRSGSQR